MEQQKENMFSVQKFLLFLKTLVLLSAASLILYKYDFEPGSPLTMMVPVFGAAFLLHFWTPKRFSLYFLTLASFAASFFLLDKFSAGTLIIIMLLFTWMARVRMHFNLKVLCALVFIAALLVVRISLVRVPLVSYAFPVAGSLLMFRAALVLYEHKYAKERPSFIQDLSYLFLLPNLALPLFPVIDYKTASRNYSPQNKTAIDKGIYRIALGILQLLLYRFIYVYCTPLLSTVHDAQTTFIYIITSYAGILHFTGLLWIGAGYCGIFGFDLPSIFDNVFLVDSFGDIWRRINIYWKEFITKLVYYPLYFKLRKKLKSAVLITVLITFVFTALMHGWQWLWLLGTPSASVNGMLYWGILGTCIAFALSGEAKKTAAVASASFTAIAKRALRIILMFLFMSFTWSLWNSPSLQDWFFLVSRFKEDLATSWMNILLTIIVAFAAISAGLVLTSSEKSEKKFISAGNIAVLLSLFILVPFGFRQVRNKLTESSFTLVENLCTPQLNSDDRNMAIESYYDQMLASNGGHRPWEMFIAAPEAASGLDQACTSRKDIVIRELIPSKTTDLGRWKIVTNSYGMRDKEYSLQKPANTYRIAILGGSYEMGSGVPADSVFENVLEGMLNDSSKGIKYEVLNFAIGGYHPPQQVWTMENKVKQFTPDLILYFVHPEDRTRLSSFMANLVHNGYDLKYPFLENIRTQCGARQSMSLGELTNRFEPYNLNIVNWVDRELSIDAAEMHSGFCIVYLPTMNSDDAAEESYYSSERNYPVSNIQHFVSLRGIFKEDPDHWKLFSDPTHPNALAHQLIAQKLFSILYPKLR